MISLKSRKRIHIILKFAGESMYRPVIVVHGGAGTWHPERQKPGIEGVKNAALEGFKILAVGGSALDAVEMAVTCLEDNEVFNAGKGSTLTIDKRVEMEASIMDGKTLKAGAVGLLRDLKNLSLIHISEPTRPY